MPFTTVMSGCCGGGKPKALRPSASEPNLIGVLFVFIAVKCLYSCKLQKSAHSAIIRERQQRHPATLPRCRCVRHRSASCHRGYHARGTAAAADWGHLLPPELPLPSRRGCPGHSWSTAP